MVRLYMWLKMVLFAVGIILYLGAKKEIGTIKLCPNKNWYSYRYVIIGMRQCDRRDTQNRESGTDSGDTSSAPPSSSCSPLSFVTEGKRRRSPTPMSTQSTCRRPCSSWIQFSLAAFVCCPAAISLLSVPGYTTTGAKVPFHQMPIFVCMSQKSTPESLTSMCHLVRAP